jgi:uncharacterized protein
VAQQETIAVEFAYGFAQQQWLLCYRLPAGISALALAERACSELLLQNPQLELPPQPWQLGIFSKPVAPERVLQDGDRVELYRALLIDPKQSRRERAQAVARGG